MEGGLVYCLDTKGGHLLTDAVARKLFDIRRMEKQKLLVRFITEGKQTELRGKAMTGGYTVWKMKSGTPTPYSRSRSRQGSRGMSEIGKAYCLTN